MITEAQRQNIKVRVKQMIEACKFGDIVKSFKQKYSTQITKKIDIATKN